jgi:hypothetical protein
MIPTRIVAHDDPPMPKQADQDRPAGIEIVFLIDHWKP